MHDNDPKTSTRSVKIKPTVGALLFLFGLAVAGLAIVQLYRSWQEGPGDTIVALPEPIGPLGLDVSSVHGDQTYVGSAHCRDCHEDQYNRWKGSHHDLAMMVADEESVIGDFNDATFTHHGVTSTFFRKGDAYYVRTEGDDGQLTDFHVLYTYGIEPLQQYLVEFPGGRLQTLPLCWDARPAAEGGQRWYHLYGDEHIPPGDELFWTGPAQNWNFSCSECHSTNLRKNYDPVTDHYHTTFAEINVSCEACHGPGSGHMAWAEQNNVADDPPDTRYDPNDAKGLVVRLKDLSGGFWQYDEQVKTYVRTKPLDSRVQLDTCARCHSRRSILTEDYHHGSTIHDTHRVSTLEPPLYELTGTIRDEVYVHGSFVQSKMYLQGVRCVDCHDAHSLKRHRPGNQLCTHCHQLSYEAPEHHFHPAGGPGTQCIDCHMPERTYMGVDKRSDHSFRIPRPDLSVKLGIPNMCNDCHDDQSFEWAAEYVEKWYGPRPKDELDYAEVQHMANVGHPEAPQRLTRFLSDLSQPAIYRATLLRLAAPYMNPELQTVAMQALQDPDPMVRSAAITTTEVLPPQIAWQAVAPLLKDPVRLVRAEAARRLAPIVPQVPPGTSGLSDYATAWANYVESIDINRDRAGPLVDYGTVLAAQGEVETAIQELRQALKIEPWFVPASINLADLFRQLNRDTEAVAAIQAALQHNPEAAVAHYVLGLAEVRQGNTKAALAALEKAATLAPEDMRINYTYAVALNSTGEADKALEVLAARLEQHPYNRDMLIAATLFSRDKGDLPQARKWVDQLLQWWPNDVEAQQLAASLQTAGG